MSTDYRNHHDTDAAFAAKARRGQHFTATHPPAPRQAPVTYMRRRLVLLILASFVTLFGLAVHEGLITDEAPPTQSPDIMTYTP